MQKQPELRVVEKFSFRPQKPLSLREAAFCQLTSVPYHAGQVETLSEVVERQATMIAELVNMLYSNGVLPADDVLQLMQGFEEAE